jgi:DNA polymerase-3 subunit delta'
MMPALLRPLAGKRDISIQQIRELERELGFHSFFGKRKVTIIDPADLMNYHAQNALLKTLEEPPGNSLLILIAESAGGLLPTLLSRCLRLSFGYPPRDLAAEFLTRRKGLPQDQAELLVALTMGSLGTALASDPSDLLDQRREWIERFVALPRGDFRQATGLAEEMASDGEQCLKFLKCIEGWYRDILVCQVGGRAENIRNIDLRERIRDWAALYRTDHVLSALSRIARVTKEVHRNYNRRLALEDLLFRVVTLQDDSSPTFLNP